MARAAMASSPRAAARTPGVSAWLLMAPILLWLLVVVVAPAVLMLVYSLAKRGTLGGVVFEFTLDNYRTVFESAYVSILVRSLLYAGLTTAICVVLAYPVAYCIGRATPPWRTRLLVLVMIPFWTSFLIRTYAWVTILKSEGLLNGLLLQLHVAGAPFEFLYRPGAVILGLVYTFLPFMILPIYASVERLDTALIEAAFDLGAGPWRAFARVIVPLTSRGIGAGVLLVFVPALGLYAVNDILGGGNVDMIGNIIENQFKGSARNWPFGAALGIVLMSGFAAAYRLSGGRAVASPRAL